MGITGRRGPRAGSAPVTDDRALLRATSAVRTLVLTWAPRLVVVARSGSRYATPPLLMHGSGAGIAGVVVVLAVLLLAAPSHDERVTLRPGGSDSVRMLAAGGAMFDRTVLAPGRVQVACTPVAVRAEPGLYTFALQAVDVSGPLAAQLFLDVDRVPARDGGACRSGEGVEVFRGTLAELTDAATQSWSADDGDQLLRFRVRMGDGARQGQQAGASFRFTLSALPVGPGTEPREEPPAGDRPAADPAPPSATPTTATPVPTTQPAPTVRPADRTVDTPTKTRTDAPDVAAGPPGSGPPTSDRTRDATAPATAGTVWPKVVDTLVEAAPIVAWPALAAAGLALFLIAQRQLDRGDPKLALAPLYDADLLLPLTAGDSVTVERWSGTGAIGGAV